LEEHVKLKRTLSERADRIQKDAINFASGSTVKQLKGFISRILNPIRIPNDQASLRGTTPHEKAIEKLYTRFRIEGSNVEYGSAWYKPDLIARLSPRSKKKYGGVRNLWIEVVDTHSPSITKMKKVTDMLGPDWKMMLLSLDTGKENLYPQ
jgi:hypothetical protein